MKRKKICWWKVAIGSVIFMAGAFIYVSVIALSAPKFLCNILAFLLMLIGSFLIVSEAPEYDIKT